MVAPEKIDFHSPFHERNQCGKDFDIAAWNHIPVLIPEIPDISKHIEGRGVVRKRIEEIHETPLPVCGVKHVTTQVHICNEIG